MLLKQSRQENPDAKPKKYIIIFAFYKILMSES